MAEDGNKTYCPDCGYLKNKPTPVQGCNNPCHKPDRITAYKTLNADYKSTYQNFIWPLPTLISKEKWEPGPWLEIEGKPILCQRGFHGWMTKKRAFQHLGQHHQPHVYEMEFEGYTTNDGDKICGTRARLVKEIFDQPQIPWEEFVKSQPTALAIAEEACALRKDTSTVDLRKDKLVAGYYPVFPAYHMFRQGAEQPNRCGDCGLNEQVHDGWEARNRLSAKLDKFDRWELILFIQQLLAGKDPGLDTGTTEGS